MEKVQNEVESYTSCLEGITTAYQTNHVLITMGDDFAYKAAEETF